ncbi:hypothetical protein F5Y01DRAFT_281195 [Xylaria sp. FL0043]|nr:hypothetical protein F5Y01DRAFT_281195 [Xylaria sp. FL0043]
MPLAQSSGPVSSSSLFSSLSEAGSITGSATLSGIPPVTKTSSSSPAIPSTMDKGPEGLDTGLIVAIAVGATLVALLFLGAAVYCCLKRRKFRRAARLQASTLSEKDISSRGFDAPFEWKPPVELPHQTLVTSRAELEESLILDAQPNDSTSQGPPVALSSLSAYSSVALRDATELQSASPHLSPAELFVTPAELPGVYKNQG